jgi:hypothetical protein
MAKFSDILGTIGASFRLGIGSTAALIKSVSSGLVVRNALDSADAPITASTINVSGDSLTLNSDGSTGADRAISIARPTTGMTAGWTLTLPTNQGTANYVLQTDGTGATSWVANSGATNQATVDTTALAFGATSPLAMFTLPANAVVLAVRFYVDIAFTGGTAPTASVGIAGNTSKYAAANPLDVVGMFEYFPTIPPVVTTEALIITYVSGGSSAGAARIQVDYAIPS